MIKLTCFLVLYELCKGSCPERYRGLSSSCHICLPSKKNLADKLCVDICPAGSFEYSSCSETEICSSPEGSIFIIDFNNTERSLQTFAEDSYLLVNSQSSTPSQNNKPFYFTENKTIRNSQNYIPSLYFSFNLWIKPLGDGNIMRVESSFRNRFIIEARENKYKFTFTAVKSASEDIWEEIFIETNPYQDIWQALSFKYRQVKCNMMELIVKINEKKSVRTFSDVQAKFSDDFYMWIIGWKDEVPSFIGFIYWLEARNNLEDNFPQFSNGVSYIESSYRGEFSCKDCISPQWPEHKSNQTVYSRKLPTCFTGCSTCSSSSFTDCTACNPSLVKYDYFCLNDCPTGKISSSNQCTGPDFGFDLDLTDSLILSQINAWDIGSDTSNIYPLYDTNDPKPVMGRGYYFEIDDRIMTTGVIAPSFTLSIWLKIINSGYILEKSTTTNYFIIEEGSGFIQVTMTMTDGIALNILAASIINAWYNLEISAEPETTGNTLIKVFTNGSQSAIGNALGIAFFDSLSADLCLGSDKTFSNGFEGFIAKLQIYQDSNYLRNDIRYTCTGGACSQCPSSSICLSECDFEYFGDNCDLCDALCTNGCKSSTTCNLCKNKECNQCSSYSNTCINCLTNADFLGTDCKCKSGFGWSSSDIACKACQISNCDLCAEDYIECTKCKSPYYYIQRTCLTFCPTGYTANNGVCDVDTARNAFVFDLKPLKIEDKVYDLQSNIPVVTGLTHDFYPVYHASDPYAAIERGYYFTGSSVMMAPPNWSENSPLLTISPEFTIVIWYYPINEGYIFSKQDLSGNIQIAVRVSSQQPTIILTLEDGSTISVLSPMVMSLNEWKYTIFSATTEYNNQNIWTNAAPNIDDWFGTSTAIFVDLDSSFTILFGAKYDSSGNLAEFYKGFLWEFKIYNKFTTELFYSSCTYSSGAWSYSPVELAGDCIPDCSINDYPDNGSCSPCDSNCLTGCKKAGSCNLCLDPLCYKCNDYGVNCNLCKDNAVLSGGSCSCIVGYAYDSATESCVQLPAITCDVSCNACSDIYYNSCITCANNYYSFAGLCLSYCPRGYYIDSNGICQLTNSIIFELDLNTLKGVVYDKIYMIPAITGSTQNFYKNYDLDDPLPAYLRGFYFNGISSMLNLPDFGSYTSPVLLIGPIFTFSVWINPESMNSVLFSKKNNSLSSYLIISLSNGYPKILINLAYGTLYSFTCQSPVSLFQWNHIAIVSNYNGLSTVITCIINTNQDADGSSPGHFSDISTNMRVTIGSDSSSLTSGTSYYKGFIYHVHIYSIANYNTDLSVASCFEDCLSCPLSHECIPNCPIYEYWLGPSYKECSDCSSSCLTCKDKSLSCNLCWNKICDICDNYSENSCLNCVENAHSPENCVCNESYEWSTNYEKCSKNDGHYAGPDGISYPCPDLCSECSSNILCSSCVENAIIADGICICNDGYRNDNQLCVKMLFLAYLSINQDNSLILSFSEELSTNISSSDINIYINTEKIDFTMEVNSLSNFYISIKIKDQISKGTEIIVHFYNNTNIRSKQGAYLITTNLYGILFGYDPDVSSDNSDSIILQTKATIQSAVSASLMLSLLSGSSSSFWSFLNFLPLLSYLPLSGINFSQKIRNFFQSLLSFNLIPNIFEWFVDENIGGKPYKNAYDAGFKTDLIFLNAGSNFTAILFLITAIPFIYYFSNCSCQYIAKKIEKVLKSYKFSIFLRFWIQVYLEIGISSLICLSTYTNWNIFQYFNKCLSVIFMLFLFITPILFIILCWKNNKYIIDQDKIFLSIWDTFFYEFKNSQGFMSTQFYTIFFFRRLVYMINLILLKDFPRAEVTINIVHSLLNTIYLIRYWPYNDIVIQVGNLITEIGILIVMCFTGAFLSDMDDPTLVGIEDTIIWTVNTIIAVNLVCSMIVSVRDIWKIIKENYFMEKNSPESTNNISKFGSNGETVDVIRTEETEKNLKTTDRKFKRDKSNKIKVII